MNFDWLVNSKRTKAMKMKIIERILLIKRKTYIGIIVGNGNKVRV